MDLTLLKDGLFVMIIGMGTVFVFLVIMIYVMQISANIIKYINKFFPEEVPQEKTSKRKISKNDNTEIAIAIACAIAESNAG